MSDIDHDSKYKYKNSYKTSWLNQFKILNLDWFKFLIDVLEPVQILKISVQNFKYISKKKST